MSNSTPMIRSILRVAPPSGNAFRATAVGYSQERRSGITHLAKLGGDATARTRTWDNHVNSVVLYQLSYGGSVHHSTPR
jgi:hypothetical protein